MSRKKISSKKPSARNRGEREPLPLRYCILTLTCGLILVVGFFFAASQHFSSIDFGIKNSKLKKQIEELETDKRQLILAREIALTPSEIKKAAKKIGFTEMTASNIEVFRPTVTSETNQKLNKTDQKTDQPDNSKSKQPVSVKSDDAPPKKVEKPQEVKAEKEKSASKTEKK